MASTRVKAGSGVTFVTLRGGLAEKRAIKTRARSGFVRQFGVLYGHVLEFARLKDFAAFLAFDELGIFFARHDLHPWVLAWRRAALFFGEWGR
jgi:hypothetical protein